LLAENLRSFYGNFAGLILTAVAGIRAITSAFSSQLGRFTGDPCLPVAYPYPWINCSSQGILPTRVLSMSVPTMLTFAHAFSILAANFDLRPHK
jgi:hypothetical protein